MKTRETVHVLGNKFNNRLTAKLIEILGPTTTVVDTEWGDGDVDFDSMKLCDGYVNNLMIANDDSWGPVTKVEMVEDHLVLTANYGDDGDYAYSPTVIGNNTVLGGYVVNTLSSGNIGAMVTLDDKFPELAFK